MADTLTRRQLAGLTGSLAASGAALAAALPAGAQETAVASPESPGLLEQRKKNRIRASEELVTFDLAYADEPLFRLVLK